MNVCDCNIAACVVRYCRLRVFEKKLLNDTVRSAYVCLLDVVATWWNTSDCKIRYSVVAITVVLRLQKQLQKSMCVILHPCHSVIATS
jgi:hypothetical protein